MDSPKPPPKLGKAGRDLWRSIVSNWELDPRELAMLAACCRQADDVARLEEALAADGLIVVGSAGQPRMNAVVTELRQSRLAVSRMLVDLRLPTESGKALSYASTVASNAAKTRWALARDREERRG